MSSKRTTRVLACLSLLLHFAPAQAQAKDWQVHGFIAQGYTLSDSNNVNGQSSDGAGSLDFREAAINASWRPLPRLLVAAQLASVQQGEVTEQDLALDYLLADWLVAQDSTGGYGIRAGKLKLPFGFYNDFRDAVFSRPGILLPQSIYLDNDGARAFGYFSGWGAMLYADHYAGRHEVSFEAGHIIKFSLEDSAEISILRRPASGRFEHDRSLILRIIDQIDGGAWRLALSASRGRLNYKPGEEPPFSQAGTFRFDQAFASVQHNREQLSLTAEFVRRRIRLDDLIPGPASSATDQDSTGYYLQSTYRLSPRLTLMSRYDERVRELQDRSGHRQAELSGLPRHYFFARDFSVGSRFDITDRLGLWGEYHWIDGVLWVNPLDNPQFLDGQAERHWSLLSLMIGYQF